MVTNSEQLKGKIEFRNVWFRYPTRKENWVLRGLNLTINPQDTVALVGESGCGKSTFVSLLMRFYDCDFGEILIDGKNIQEYNLHSLRQHMGFVMQEPVLFNYSILDNILYGKNSAANSEVHLSAEIANALDFIQNFKEDDGELDLTKANHLKTQLAQNEARLVGEVGQKTFDDYKTALDMIIDHEINNNATMKGDIDLREQNLKDMQLHHGFEIECGVKGSKLSGG